MPLITIFECEPPCGKRIEIGDNNSSEAAEILQVTDCMGNRLFFHNVECLRKWAAKYKSPYKHSAPDPTPIDAILPGGVNSLDSARVK